MDLFLFERNLDKAFDNLENFLHMRGGPQPYEPPDDIPFQE